MVIHTARRKNDSGFVCLAICGGKERRYHSSSEEDSEVRVGKFDLALASFCSVLHLVM